MRKLFASFVLLCCVSSLHAESLLYTTSFTEWENQTVSGEQMMSYSGIDFAVSYVKIVPNSKPTSVSSYEGTGYIQPSNGSNLSSCYFQTGKLSYVSTVNYTQAAGTAGCGWRLESSSDGVNFYPFNENDAGCTSKNTPEIREANVFMNDVWLRWAPITSGTNTTNIYLMDINIYGEEGGMGTADLQRVYCKMNFQWWTESGAAVGIYAYGDGDITNAAWPGERMVLVDADNGVWTAEVDKSKFTHIIFTRMNPSDDGGSLDWGAQTENLSIPSPDAPVFVMTSSAAAWNESGARVQGYWAAYNEDGNYDTHNVRLTTGFTPEESAAYVYPSSGDYETGSTVSLNAEISTGGWMFDHWSDNGSWDNPRTVTLTQDTTITAVFSPGEYGILINRGRLVRGTYTGRENEHTYVGQFKASVSLQEGDRIQIINLFHSDNSTWRPEIEEGGMSGDFSVDEGLDALMCNQTGCYDIYMKIHYGQSSDYVYIGGGEDYSEGEAVNIDGSGEITEYVYSLVGTAQLFGTAWDVNDSTVLQQEGTNLWSYTLQSVHLNAFQKYEYKVVTNHSWEVGTYPSNSENYSFHVPHTGYYSVHFSFNVTTGASVTETSVIEDESYKDTLVYSNYAVTINGERIVPCVYAGVGDAGLPEYLARVQVQSGEYLEVIDRSNNNAKVGYSMDEYGLSGNFIYKNDSNRYSCSVSGCYDVYYKTDGAVYFGAGSSACSQGLPFDGSVLATGELYLSGPSYISSDSQKGWVKLDGSNNTTTITQRIALGATVTIEAVPNSGYQFLQWSDNNYANPRELVITGDSIIQAEMGSIDLYPVGILLNRKKFVRSTFNDGAQLTVRANIQQGDTIELYYTTSNIYFMAPLEQYGAYTNFTEQSGENRLICNVSGCYDIYFKLQEGITQTIYIGEGTQCFDGVDWTAPAEPDYVYSLVGTANLFGEAWVTQDTTTELKLQGENMYTYTIDSIALYPDSSYQYKVISNHEWNVKEYPNFEENYTLFVEEPGVYQVLFMLDPSVGCSATTNYLHAIQETQPCVSPIASGTCSDDQTVSVVFKTASSDGTTAYSDDSSIKENLVNSYSGIEKFTGERLYAGKSGIKLGSTSASGSITMQLSTPIMASMIIVEASQYGSDNATLSISVNGSTTFGEQLTVTSDVLTFNNPETLINSLTVTTTTKQRVYIRAITIFSNSSSGGGLNWSISCDNVLTISGTGAMANYMGSSEVPWHAYAEQIHQAVINEGITSLSSSSTFEGCTNLTSVSIPEGITSLGDYTFSDCSSLTAIDLPSTMTSLGSYCFNNCVRIDTIISRATTPPSANGSTFAGTNYMLTVYVPVGTTEAYQAASGWDGFTDFRELTSSCIIASGKCGADADSANVVWSLSCDSVLIISGTGAMADYNDPSAGSGPIAGGDPGDINPFAPRRARQGDYKPNSPWMAYSSSTIKSAVVEEGVTRIGDNAFNSCMTMTRISLPDGLQYIGNSAFYACYALDTIISYNPTPAEIQEYTFDSSTKASCKLLVPADSRAAYQQATYWSQFANVLPIGGCTIASGECGAQGDNVTWKLSCDSVLTISGSGAMANYSVNSTGQAPWAEYGLQIRDIVIEEGVTSISAYGFYNAGSYTNGAYNNVRSVSIPSTVKALSNNYFYQCPIQSVAINSDSIVGHTSYSSGSSLHRIFGAQVREYFIGNDVKSIANFAFYNQSPDSVTYITLPDGLQSIGSWAFGYIEHLTFITVPDEVQTIGTDAFAGCEKLESVVLGKSLTSIGGQAFWKDSLLRYVTCNALTPPTLNSTAFDVYGTLNVPCEAKQSYREADYWKQFSLITCGDEMVITFELSSDWTFVMIPGLFGMQPEDVTVNGEVTWATYNGSVRAMGASGWELFDAESVHICSQALIARAKQGTVTLNIVVPNQARNKQEVYVPVSQHPATYAQNANWCFIGNPYPYSYNITAALDAAGIDSPVTIWNGTGYTTYTPGIDEFVLQPFQPFFIQLSDDAPENILFTPDYITE